MEEVKSNRGGKREGAGRKKVNVRAISIQVPQDIADILDKVEHKKEWICQAIRLLAKVEAAENKPLPTDESDNVP